MLDAAAQRRQINYPAASAAARQREHAADLNSTGRGFLSLTLVIPFLFLTP